MADLFTQLQTALAERYALERELGRGGMATVYLARDLRHRRPVALKVLHPELAYAVGADRFLREIEVAANLSHPHILPLHDSGEVEGLLYYVMPYVEGESLRDRLGRERQLPIEDALRITREVGDALAYAHGHGVIHRDIKPENILLSGGHALVADFGIARAVGQAGGDRLTETGLAIGTAAYMSPEQATGEGQLDGRSDVYSLGCVLYEMLAGEPPHTGPSAQAILARALTGSPRPIHPMRAGVTPALDGVIAKAIAVTPADRYAGAAELVAALEVAIRLPTPADERASRQDSPGITAGEPSHRVRGVRALAQRPLFAILVVGVLLGAGALFAWRRSHGAGDESGAKLLAVLPFENLGDSADAYFADGVADEIRGKLGAVPGLRVIARSSSMEYRKTTKPLAQIARELGVQYVLTATVRWEKQAGGASVVHVLPELVQVSERSAPQGRWQQRFDAPLTNLFQVQAEIAGQVAQALQVALADSARQQLAETPTANLRAYDAYLRGKEVWPTLFASDPAMLRLAAAYYEQAVALDSNFAQAWAQLSLAHSVLYFNSTPTPAGAERSRQAAERARHLSPTRGITHLALAFYHGFVRGDVARATDELGQGRRVAPDDADLLNAAGYFDQSLGQWDSALVHFQRAQLLDPRSVDPPRNLTQILLYLRQYPQARAAANRALVLAPTNVDVIECKAMIALAEGDLLGARAVIAAVPKEVDPAALVANFATYWDLGWVLDDAQQQLLIHLTPSAFDDDRGTWGLVLAQTYALRGNAMKARVYADSARLGYEEQLRATPDDPLRRMYLALALAYLNRKADAIREGKRAVALWPMAKDALNGPYLQHQLVRIYMLLGEPEKALDQLEPLLKIPYYLSPGWLKIDPNFDPLRGNPRFQRLVSGT